MITKTPLPHGRVFPPDPVSPGKHSNIDFSAELWGPDGYPIGELRKTNRDFNIEVKIPVSERSVLLTHFLHDLLAPLSRSSRQFRFFPTFVDGLLAELELSGLDEDLWPQIRHLTIWTLFNASKENP